MAALILSLPAAAFGKQFEAWGPAAVEAAVNSAAPDGCPIESPNGRSLYIASTRSGTLGGNDIWVAHRTNDASPWSAPENLGAPVNSEFNDYCPTPLHGNWLLFVSERPGPGTCSAGPGKGDIYIARFIPSLGWGAPRHLGCDADGTGPNFPGGEFGPSLVTTSSGTFLFFSSTGYGADMNIYMSRLQTDGRFGPATLVDELNTEYADFMPNVSRNGLEIVFNSNRPGGEGLQDVYTASRASTNDPWSELVNVGTNVNTAGNETRSSLSGDGERLHFGRDGEIYVSIRNKVTGGD
ncbi:MAG: hypothetical protein WED12_08005 [Chloroflexota bacterium]